jgi:hydrogenase expression/formation protein HypE
MANKAYRIEAVLFDFDGTLTKPGALNFPSIKRTLGCPAEKPILEFIAGLPTQHRQEEAKIVLERFERIAAENSEPNSGAEDLIHYLRSKGLGLGILTRNSFDSLERALQNFKTVAMSDFEVIITRNTPVKPKPSPDGVLLAAQKLKINPNRILVVGDFVFDIQAGQLAGSLTVWLDNGLGATPCNVESDFRISCLEELKDIIRLGTPLPAGRVARL